ncbi:o-succinylbenzoate synthase [Thiocystis violacea]|uniref:o-succinylbenzoate synthase n=1 Tax=Thiocystis violacea TaxID=13725 RepID=UPI001907CF7F|nr:o-succinylbenzoate synthase [Thiocystis violacea]
MIDRLLIHPYDLPLRRPWESARGGFERRRGLVLQVWADGLRGFGDCAPLPAAGTEDLEQATQALADIQASSLRGAKPETLLEQVGAALSSAPAARFALECALLDLISQGARTSLRHLLRADAKDRVPVNVMAGTLSSLTPAAIALHYERGFRVLKIKVGQEAPRTELTRLEGLTPHVPPDMGLRLDANGAWDLKDAERMLGALARLPIESLEEPLRDPTSVRLARLQSGVPFPLARDESLRALPPDTDPASLGVRRLVLKPAAIGGLGRTLDLARTAMAAGLEVVVTSLVETAAGLWPTAQLAAATGSSVPHGLATSDWLAQDLGMAPTPRDGFIHLPLTAGSGFIPNA